MTRLTTEAHRFAILLSGRKYSKVISQRYHGLASNMTECMQKYTLKKVNDFKHLDLLYFHGYTFDFKCDIPFWGCAIVPVI